MKTAHNVLGNETTVALELLNKATPSQGLKTIRFLVSASLKNIAEIPLAHLSGRRPTEWQGLCQKGACGALAYVLEHNHMDVVAILDMVAPTVEGLARKLGNPSCYDPSRGAELLEEALSSMHPKTKEATKARIQENAKKDHDRWATLGVRKGVLLEEKMAEVRAYTERQVMHAQRYGNAALEDLPVGYAPCVAGIVRTGLNDSLTQCNIGLMARNLYRALHCAAVIGDIGEGVVALEKAIDIYNAKKEEWGFEVHKIMEDIDSARTFGSDEEPDTGSLEFILRQEDEGSTIEEDQDE